MKIRIFILQLLLLVTFYANAQEILGTVINKKKDPVINASIRVTQGGILKLGTITDYDGKYSAKPLEPGLYDVNVAYPGMKPQTVTGVVVTAGDKTLLNFTLTNDESVRECVIIKAYKKPLIDPYRNSTIIQSPDGYRNNATTRAQKAAMAPGVYQSKRGADISADGGRTSGNVYIVDGIQVQGATNVNMAQGATEQLDMKSGKYFNPSNEEYKKVHENDFMMVSSSPLSTMSVDVDRASYSNIRRYITSGQNPPADAVRIEEMVNYFTYNYPQPKKSQPLAIQTELTRCPWNTKHELLRVGMQAKNPEITNLPASNLTFLIDVSGSMNEPSKLPLLKESLRLLVKALRKEDKVALVVYAGSAGLVLPPTNGDKKQAILDAIDALEAGGSTAGGAGILLAYKTAKDNFIEGGNNRVILATDGDFNVGVSSDNELETLITEKRKSGIFLTCLGFGQGNYKDAKMEMLADKGNGNYDYIDNIQEAEKTLVKEFNSTLFTVAKDVKAQIEFNPEKVLSYRLIGYENRMLNTEDFKDDKKDAGDMGAGHTVTILYEIVPAGAENDEEREVDRLKYQKSKPTNESFSNELATIKFRYKEADDSVSKEMKHIVANETIDFATASENTRFAAAVALFGMVLKGSQYKGNGNYANALEMAKASKGTDAEGYRAELINLITTAKANSEKVSSK